MSKIGGHQGNQTPPMNILKEGYVVIKAGQPDPLRRKKLVEKLVQAHRRIFKRQRPWTYDTYVLMGYMHFKLGVSEAELARMLNRSPEQVHRALTKIPRMKFEKNGKNGGKTEAKNGENPAV